MTVNLTAFNGGSSSGSCESLTCARQISEAIVYCAAFALPGGSGANASESHAASSSEIISRAAMASISQPVQEPDSSGGNCDNAGGAEYTATVIIPTLVPATAYAVQCLTASSDGTLLPLAQAQQSITTATTLCCKEVSVEIMHRTLLTSSTALDAVIISAEAPPSSTASLLVSLNISSAEVGNATTDNIGTNSAVGTASLLVPAQVRFTSHSGAGAASSFQSASSVGLRRAITLSAGALPGRYSIEATLSGSAAVEYVVVFTGPSSPDSGGEVVDLTSFSVLGTAQPPPIPRLLSAVFDTAGTEVQVFFDSATDKAGLSSLFPCAQLLLFAGDSYAQCQWRDAATIVLRPLYRPSAPEQVISVGAQLSLAAGSNIRAQCWSEITSSTACSKWATALTDRQVTVRAPAAPSQPVVSISAPAVIGDCSNLSLDLSASTGSAGRPWLSASVSVLSSTASSATLTALVEFMQDLAISGNLTSSPPPRIPAELLDTGSSYTFIISLCSFLRSCGSASWVVKVRDNVGESEVAIAVLQGRSQRTVRRDRQLAIKSSSYIENCDGSIDRSNLLFSWQLELLNTRGVTAAPLAYLQLNSTSQNPALFKLPPFSLLSNGQYRLLHTVRSSRALHLRSTVEALLVVQPGELVPLLTGGTRLTLQAGATATLDASRSFDEEVTGRTGQAAGLSFDWSCVQTAPVYSAACSLDLLSYDPNDVPYFMQQNLTVLAPRGAENSTSRVTVTVFDSTRAASLSIEVVVVPDPAPVLDITSTPVALTRINAAKKLALAGRVELAAGTAACVASWVAEDGALATPSTEGLAALALTPVQSPLLATGVHTFDLLLPAGTLPPSSHSLEFKLSCGAATTSVLVSTNSNPNPGSFSVRPSHGIELSSVFTFQAAGWSDEDLPLSYQLSARQSAFGPLLTLFPRAELTAQESVLAAGSALDGYTVVCELRVFDVLDAVTISSSTVEVLPGSASLAEGIPRLKVMSRLLAGAGKSLDETVRVVALVSAALSTTNCSLAPNCSSLHRYSCGSNPVVAAVTVAEHSCGECLPGFFGDAGPGNSVCAPIQISAAAVPSEEQFCFTDADCETWQRCQQVSAETSAITDVFSSLISPSRSIPTGLVGGSKDGVTSDGKGKGENAEKSAQNGRCVFTQKSCAQGCTPGQGSCMFVRTSTGLELSRCPLNDFSCEAQCVCLAGFTGAACERDALAADEVAARLLRAELLNRVQYLTELDDVNDQSLPFWAEALKASVAMPYGLNATEVQLVHGAAESAIYNALRDKSSRAWDNADTLFAAIQAVDAVLKASSTVQSKADAMPSGEGTGGGSSVERSSGPAAAQQSAVPWERTLNLVRGFAELVAGSMVPGQAPVIYTADSFRTSTQVLDPIASAAATVTATTTFLAATSTTAVTTAATAASTATSGATANGEEKPAGTMATIVFAAAAGAPSSASLRSTVITTLPKYYRHNSTTLKSNPFELSLAVKARAAGGGGSGATSSSMSVSGLVSEIVFRLQHFADASEFAAPAAQLQFTTECQGQRLQRNASSYICPFSGVVLHHSCEDRYGTLTSYCPQPTPSCARLNASTAETSLLADCRVLNFTAAYTTCVCDIASSSSAESSTPTPATWPTTSTRSDSGTGNGVAQQHVKRTLADKADGSGGAAAASAEDTLQRALDETGVTNMVVGTEYVTSQFADTFVSAGEFDSTEDLRRVLIVIVMFSVVWAVGLLFACSLMVGAYRQPVKQYQKRQLGRRVGKIGPSAMEARRYVQRYIESLIPPVYAHSPGRSPILRMAQEVAGHHRYLILFTKKASEGSMLQRTLVVLKMLTTQTMLMFLLALLYDLEEPGDDGSCDDQITQAACLERKTMMDSDRSYCHWEEKSDGRTDCSYQESEVSLKVFIYLMIIIAVFTACFNTPIDWAFALLAAPTHFDVQKLEQKHDGHLRRRIAGMAESVASNVRRASNVAATAAAAAAASSSSTSRAVRSGTSRLGATFIRELGLGTGSRNRAEHNSSNGAAGSNAGTGDGAAEHIGNSGDMKGLSRSTQRGSALVVNRDIPVHVEDAHALANIVLPVILERVQSLHLDRQTQLRRMRTVASARKRQHIRSVSQRHRSAVVASAAAAQVATAAAVDVVAQEPNTDHSRSAVKIFFEDVGEERRDEEGAGPTVAGGSTAPQKSRRAAHRSVSFDIEEVSGEEGTSKEVQGGTRVRGGSKECAVSFSLEPHQQEISSDGWCLRRHLDRSANGDSLYEADSGRRALSHPSCTESEGASEGESTLSAIHPVMQGHPRSRTTRSLSAGSGSRTRGGGGCNSNSRHRPRSRAESNDSISSLASATSVSSVASRGSVASQASLDLSHEVPSKMQKLRRYPRYQPFQRLRKAVLDQRLLLNEISPQTEVFDEQWGLLPTSDPVTAPQLRSDLHGSTAAGAGAGARAMNTQPSSGDAESIQEGRGGAPAVGSTKSTRVLRHKFEMLESAAREIEAEVERTDQLASTLRKALAKFTVQHAGMDILHLFIMDVLGRRTKAAQIFQSKFEEDFQSTRLVSLTAKMLASTALIFMNVFFIYYSLLQGFRKGVVWQRQYLQACIVQFFIEVFLFETLECVWLNYIVPSLVRGEVRQAAEVLRGIADQIAIPDGAAAAAATGGMSAHKQQQHAFLVDAPTYLFVSTKVARAFPDLLESAVVLSYTSPLPGPISTVWKHPHSIRSAVKSRQQQQQLQCRKELVGGSVQQTGGGLSVIAGATATAMRPQAPSVALGSASTESVGAKLNAESEGNSDDSYYEQGNNWHTPRRQIFLLATTCAALVVAALQSLGTLPFFYQRVVIRVAQPVLISGITLLWLLASEHPLYVALMALSLVVAAISAYVFMLHYHHRTERQKLQQRFLGLHPERDYATSDALLSSRREAGDANSGVGSERVGEGWILDPALFSDGVMSSTDAASVHNRAGCGAVVPADASTGGVDEGAAAIKPGEAEGSYTPLHLPVPRAENRTKTSLGDLEEEGEGKEEDDDDDDEDDDNDSDDDSGSSGTSYSSSEESSDSGSDNSDDLKASSSSSSESEDDGKGAGNRAGHTLTRYISRRTLLRPPSAVSVTSAAFSPSSPLVPSESQKKERKVGSVALFSAAVTPQSTPPQTTKGNLFENDALMSVCPAYQDQLTAQQLRPSSSSVAVRSLSEGASVQGFDFILGDDGMADNNDGNRFYITSSSGGSGGSGTGPCSLTDVMLERSPMDDKLRLFYCSKSSSNDSNHSYDSLASISDEELVSVGVGATALDTPGTAECTARRGAHSAGNDHSCSETQASAPSAGVGSEGSSSIGGDVSSDDSSSSSSNSSATSIRASVC